MGAESFRNKAVDVICQINKDGTMVPMKVRLVDEDGLIQTYMIKAYRDLSHKGNFQMPNGVIATSTIFPFECKITNFGREHTILLYYHANLHVWQFAVPEKPSGPSGS